MSPKDAARPRRIGLVVIDNDPIPELEIRPTDGVNASVVATRFLLNRAPGKIYLGEGRQDDVPPEILGSLEQLDRIGVDAVGLCFTSSSVFAPATFDHLFVDAAQRVNDQWTVATAARSIIDALITAGSSRPFIVAPPWFSDQTVHAVIEYLDYHGISNSGWHRYQLGPEWADIKQQDLFDRGAAWDIDPSDLVNQVTRSISPSSDAVLVPGSGFRSTNAQDELQCLAQMPVISANSALKQTLFASERSALHG